MGSCSGKSQTAPVVIIKRTGENSQRPQSRVSEGTTNSKINEQSVSENKEIDEETNFALSNVKGSQQEIPNMKIGASYQQNAVDNRVFVEKEKEVKEEELNDNDEADFVNRIGQNQKQNVKPNINENKENQNDMFALNFPANNFSGKNKNESNKPLVSTERRKDMNRNKEKNLRDIINDPDGNENSFSSDVNLKTMSKGKEDDFDRIEEKDGDFYKEKRGSENEYYVERRGKEENVSDRIESVSLMKENKYKEELSQSRAINLNNERKNENRHSWETNHEQDVYNKELYDPEDENIESEMKENKSPNKLKKSELKESKLPWEKRSGSPGDFQDENEIEFFEEFDE